MMNILSELGILFLLCMVCEAITALLPLTIPSSVIALVVLLLLLLTGILKERAIQCSATFLTANMGVLFVPALVGMLDYLDVLKAQLIPFFVITLVSTPVVYCVTAWTMRLLMKWVTRKETRHV